MPERPNAVVHMGPTSSTASGGAAPKHQRTERRAGGGAPGPQAHGNAARPGVDDRRAEVCGQRQPPNDPRNDQNHSPNTPTTGLRERGNNTSGSTGRSGRQNAATRRNMRRDERVTVQGPGKEQQPDGMSHRGGGGGWALVAGGGDGRPHRISCTSKMRTRLRRWTGWRAPAPEGRRAVQGHAPPRRCGPSPVAGPRPHPVACAGGGGGGALPGDARGPCTPASDALEGGGGTPPSTAPGLCPATVPLTPSTSVNGICNRQ